MWVFNDIDKQKHFFEKEIEKLKKEKSSLKYLPAELI
jgi:hypothetical protein